MFPGLNTRLSEIVVASTTTIDCLMGDLIRVTGSTAIATITPHFMGLNQSAGGIIFIVPTDGTIATTTAGNIAVVVTMPQNKVTTLVYSGAKNKWYPAISA